MVLPLLEIPHHTGHAVYTLNTPPAITNHRRFSSFGLRCGSDITHHCELRRQEKSVGFAVDRLRPEVEVLHWAREPLVLGEKAGEVEGEQAREEKRTNEPFPSLQQKQEKEGKREKPRRGRNCQRRFRLNTRSETAIYRALLSVSMCVRVYQQQPLLLDWSIDDAVQFGRAISGNKPNNMQTGFLPPFWQGLKHYDSKRKASGLKKAPNMKIITDLGRKSALRSPPTYPKT